MTALRPISVVPPNFASAKSGQQNSMAVTPSPRLEQQVVMADNAACEEAMRSVPRCEN
jgi:hypothetical protein